MTLTGYPVPLPADRVVHRVVERHARKSPHHLAVTAGADQLTYAQLNRRANRFAHYLAHRGIGPGSVVGICLDRSVDLLPTILGVLKAGAAYVPLDPTYPQERLSLMLTQLDQLRLTVASQDTIGLLSGELREVILVESFPRLLKTWPDVDPEVDVQNEDLCYVVFTSGSTGTPKAVAIRHEGWYNLLEWLRLEYRLDGRSSGLSLSSLGFDISQRGLMMPLFLGATSHLLPSHNFDPKMAYRAIGAANVKTLHCAPSALYVLVDIERALGLNYLTQMNYVFIGGEPLKVGRVQHWATKPGNQCQLLHQYGVAECTDVASSHLLSDYSRYDGAIPAGRPVYNTEIRILDENLEELPDNEVGEICISGISVGAGYLNAASSDARRFAEIHVDGRPVRIYRTGDRGYVNKKELVVVGRVDAQVKIRGMRIDLGDVEHALQAHRWIEDAVVLTMPSEDGPRLVAFVMPTHEVLDIATLRANLFGVLPRNMVPEEFVTVPSFPMNPNGKVDRLALLSALTR